VDEPEDDWAGEFLSSGDGDGPEATPAWRRRPRVALLVLAAALVVAGIVLALRPAAVATEAGDVVATSAAPAPSSPTAAAPEASEARSAAQSASQSAAQDLIDADADAQRQLAEVAGRLPERIELASPLAWDRWLPEGKPFPGASTEEDMATCPRLTDRLEAALGTEMSYWTGTLPQGPSGCTWATVPLSYGPDPYDYPYLASVGFLADGTTTEQLSTSFYYRQGRICPSIPVPSAGDGAFLVRCGELDGTTYVLVTRDTRTAGVWVLNVSARADAAHPAADLIPPVVDGVISAFG
jgi:hypothetical protein